MPMQERHIYKSERHTSPDAVDKRMNALSAEGFLLVGVSAGGQNGEAYWFTMRKIERFEVPNAPALGDEKAGGGLVGG